MGRASRQRVLNLWMNDAFVGRWVRTTSGEHRLYYDREWLEHPDSRPISLSLPLHVPNSYIKGSVVEQYFDNLLPDSDIIRQRMQRRFGTPSRQAFDLLLEVGRDCVGALQLLPDDCAPFSVKSINYEPMESHDIEQFLERTTSEDFFRTGDKDDFRISIAGAQEKNAILHHDGRWGKPLGTTPSTHILKLPLGNIGLADMSSSVENEWLCLNILQKYGVRTAAAEIARFGTKKVLVVERFDRKLSSDKSWILRLPQEDFCQATGTSPGMKYENDGGPGIREILDILLHSERAFQDRHEFFKTQILYWMLAAIDGHAKNFSIFLKAKGEFYAAPVYDVLSAYPVMGVGGNRIHPRKIKMAMAVHGNNKHYQWYKIRKDHWIKTAAKNKIDPSEAERIMHEIIETTPSVIEQAESMIPADFPEYLADSIFSGLAAAAEKMEE